MKINRFFENKYHISSAEIAKRLGYNYVDLRLKEVLEVDDENKITGFSFDLSQEEIDELTKKDLIFFDTFPTPMSDIKPFFLEENKKDIKEFIEIYRKMKNFNL